MLQNLKRKKHLLNKPQTPQQLLGKLGEDRAVQFLISKKYKILTVNYKRVSGEVDIIAQDKNEIVFVEVKTRTGSYTIHPSEAVDSKKMERIFQTGTQYLKEKKITADFRCDIITLLPNSVEHFQNVSF